MRTADEWDRNQSARTCSHEMVVEQRSGGGRLQSDKLAKMHGMTVEMTEKEMLIEMAERDSGAFCT